MAWAGGVGPLWTTPLPRSGGRGSSLRRPKKRLLARYGFCPPPATPCQFSDGKKGPGGIEGGMGVSGTGRHGACGLPRAGPGPPPPNPLPPPCTRHWGGGHPHRPNIHKAPSSLMVAHGQGAPKGRARPPTLPPPRGMCWDQGSYPRQLCKVGGRPGAMRVGRVTERSRWLPVGATPAARLPPHPRDNGAPIGRPSGEGGHGNLSSPKSEFARSGGLLRGPGRRGPTRGSRAGGPPTEGRAAKILTGGKGGRREKKKSHPSPSKTNLSTSQTFFWLLGPRGIATLRGREDSGPYPMGL